MDNESQERMKTMEINKKVLDHKPTIVDQIKSQVLLFLHNEKLSQSKYAVY